MTDTRATRGKLMITAFGWNDSGGGTTVPRLAAKELARRGWDVTVFHAAVKPTGSRVPYEVVQWEEDGVRLIGVHNRPHLLFDIGNPLRELDDPPITAAFAEALDRLRPDVVHFHNLHNLGAALMDQVSVRGLPAFFTTHNYWLICPRAYLLTGQGAICPGPGDGVRCATCTGSSDAVGHHERLAAIRSRAESGLNRILAVSDAVRHALTGAGYSAELVDVLRQAMPHEDEIWNAVGRERVPGRRNEVLTVAFLGSAYPHKGPQLLVEAAQRMQSQVRVQIIGEVQPSFAEQLKQLDQRGLVELHGSFSPSDLGDILADADVAVLPSVWWDCAPLAAAECLAARVPLVVPRLGGLPEAVRDGVDGLVFEALDVDDLARQLDRLASEPGLLERLQSNIEAPRAFSDYIDDLEAYYDGASPAGYTSAAAVSPPTVRWKGDHGLAKSLSIINDEISERLPLPVQRVDRQGNAVDAPLPHPADVEVHHQWPPDFQIPPSGRLAAIVPWEFGPIPRQWMEHIQRSVDEVWVPSEYVRKMYLDSGVDPKQVKVVPNGVDLDVFRPASGDQAKRDGRLRFLYVGGIAHRKGVDLLVSAWEHAFFGRDDVVLVIKAALAGGAYGGPNHALRARAAAPGLPRIELIEDDLEKTELAEIYRSCDVFVLPYRGEGFAMPVLEAMASGLPVIVTAGGPTDEFCPAETGWRIRSAPMAMPVETLGGLLPDKTPWMLEPEHDHLVELLKTAAGTSAAERRAMGLAARTAAERYSWEDIAQLYSKLIVRLATGADRSPGSVPTFPFEEEVEVRVLATPAWRGDDRLSELLREWAACTSPQTSACLYLLADPATAGEPEEIEAHVLAAADEAGVDLDNCADINVLVAPFRSDREARLHATVGAYVPLHAGCAGHVRGVRKAGGRILSLGDGQFAAALAAVPHVKSTQARADQAD